MALYVLTLADFRGFSEFGWIGGTGNMAAVSEMIDSSGTEFGLAPDQPFNRAKYAQWRCYWDFGAGMFTDLFVHRTTSMLAATGLRFPGLRIRSVRYRRSRHFGGIWRHHLNITIA